MHEFIINFSYQGQPYTGLVRPKEGVGEEGYRIKLESENQEINLEIFAQPCGDSKMEWCFREVNQTSLHDKDLLREIGEAIEDYQSGLT